MHVRALSEHRPSLVLLGSGVLMAGIDPDAAVEGNLFELLQRTIAEGTNVLGLTDGGSFVCLPKLKRCETGGRTAMACDVLCTGWTVKLIGRAHDVSETALQLLGTAQEVMPEQEPTPVRDLCWVGDTNEGLMLIHMQQAINTDGLKLTKQERRRGYVSFCYEAVLQDTAQDTLCRLLLLKEGSP